MSETCHTNPTDAIELMWEYATRLHRVDPDHELVRFYINPDDPEFARRFGTNYALYVDAMRDALEKMYM